MISADPYPYDEKIIKVLSSFADENKDFWSFSRKTDCARANVYFQYPAMMVPQMLKQLIHSIKVTMPEERLIYDPFMGSGTTMAEAMFQGMDFIGSDINPLSYLLCAVKSGPFHHESLKNKAKKLFDRLNEKVNRNSQVTFKGINKWFVNQVASDLACIRRSIMMEDTAWARRFFWVCLAETVRLTSNSRTSTFKLHIRPKEEILKRIVDVKVVFKKVLDRNIDQMLSISNALKKLNLLNDGIYKGAVSFYMENAASNIYENIKKETCDVLITSPPYGDNRTTVPYGQFSYLPLQWIPLSDILPELDTSYLSTTCKIDSQSFGGSIKDAIKKYSNIREKSPSLAEAIDKLRNEPNERTKRVAAFFFDFDCSLDPILHRLKENAYMFWVVGNRKVGGHRIPFDRILIEFLEERGAVHLLSIKRRIPTKRMAIRNSITDTMHSETIIVLRKGA